MLTNTVRCQTHLTSSRSTATCSAKHLKSLCACSSCWDARCGLWRPLHVCSWCSCGCVTAGVELVGPASVPAHPAAGVRLWYAPLRLWCNAARARCPHGARIVARLPGIGEALSRHPPATALPCMTYGLLGALHLPVYRGLVSTREGQSLHGLPGFVPSLRAPDLSPLPQCSSRPGRQLRGGGHLCSRRCAGPGGRSCLPRGRCAARAGCRPARGRLARSTACGSSIASWAGRTEALRTGGVRSLRGLGFRVSEPGVVKGVAGAS